MLLSVLIVSYNTKDLTLQTIKSVVESVKNSELLTQKTEIIVIDNNSKDKSVSAIEFFQKKSDFPISIIKNKDNVGFGKANNQGIKKAQGTYLLFLNSDTIVRGNALENLVKRFEVKQPDVSPENNYSQLGIISPILLNEDLSYQPQGGSYPNLFTLASHMFFLDDIPVIGRLFSSTQHTGKANTVNLEYLENKSELIPIDWVAGTALFTTKKVLQDIGTFDPNIFMYAEDTELCMRAQNHHYDVALDPTAQIIHLQSASSGSANAVKGEFTGYKYIFSKHYSVTTAALAKIILQIGALLRIFIFGTVLQQKEKAKIYSSVLKDLD